MSRRNTHSLVLVLPSRYSICSSPPSSSSPSSSSFSITNIPAQCSATCSRPSQFNLSAPSSQPPATDGHSLGTQLLPCLPTVFKLGLVTPDTPAFHFRASQDGGISKDDHMSRNHQTEENMECHICTPNLTNSPGSPLDLDLDCSFEEFERYLPLSNLPTPPPSDPSSPSMLVEVDFEEELNPELFGRCLSIKVWVKG